MTDEELSLRIKEGEAELLPQLWSQVEGFVKMKARTYYRIIQIFRKVAEFDECDLVQSGYFAMIKTTKQYEASMEFRFITALNYSLKSEFRKVAGTRNKDALQFADSFDREIDPETNSTMYDIIADKMTEGDGSVDTQALEIVYQMQLHEVLDRSIDLLTEKQQDVIRWKYYCGLTRNEIAKRNGCTPSSVGTTEVNALHKMYITRYQTGLNQFYDNNSNYYQKIGVTQFKSNRTSVVERIVFEQNERARRWLRGKKSTKRGNR